MRIHPSILLVIALLATVTGSAAELDDAERVELKLNEPLRLERFGGAVNVALSLTQNDRESFTIVEDSSDGSGSAMTPSRKGRLVPQAMARTVTHRKQNGIDLGRFAKAYLAYEDADRLKIYFCDGAVAGPDRFLFLIKRLPRAVAQPAAPAPAPLLPDDLATARRVEVKRGEPLDFRLYGGGNTAIFVQSNDRDSFTVVIDSESMRAKRPARWEPAPTGMQSTYPKRFGFPAGRSATAYVVYTDETGLRAYFCDTLDVSLNHDLFLLVSSSAKTALPAANATPTSVDTATPQAAPPSVAKGDPAAPATAPAWSMIGATLLYGARELSRNIDADAARVGLPREIFVEERVWIAKQAQYGGGRAGEYEQQFAQRQERRPVALRAAVEQMRRAYLPAR